MKLMYVPIRVAIANGHYCRRIDTAVKMNQPSLLQNRQWDLYSFVHDYIYPCTLGHADTHVDTCMHNSCTLM